MKLIKYVGSLIALCMLTGCELGPDEVSRMNSAKQSLESRDYRSAMIELKSVLQENPENKEARLLLGELYIPLGDGVSAQKELQRVQQPGIIEPKLSISLARAFLLQNKFDDALKWSTLPEGSSSQDQSKAASIQGDVYIRQGNKQEARRLYKLSSVVLPQSESGLISMVKLLLLDNALERAMIVIDETVLQYPESAEAWLLRGKIGRSSANHLLAEESFKSALKATGTEQLTLFGFQARLGILQSKLAQSDLAGGEEHINVLLKQLPAHPMPKYFDALVAYQRQDFEAANERLLQVLKVMDKHVPSLLLMGATQYALGQYEQASQYLSQVVLSVPSHLQARKMLAAVHLKLELPMEAVKVLAPVVEDDSVDVELLSMVGQAALSAGDIDNSEIYLNRALAQGDSAALRSELAKVFLAKGEYEDAIKELKKIEGRDELQARMMIVLAHLKNDHVDRATSAISALVDEYPDDSIVDVLQAGVYLTQGFRDRARASYLRALSKEKLLVSALLGVARIDSEDGRLIEAEEYFNQVLLVDGNNLQAFFGLAQIAERKNDLSQALLWVDRARKANPALVEPTLILARYYMREQQYDKAAGVVKEGIENRPNQLLLRRLDARIKFEQGNKSEAIEVLRGAAELDSEDSVLLLELATMQRELGHEEQARQTLLKGLRTVPGALNLEVELIELEIASGRFDSSKTRIERLKRGGEHRAVAFGLDGNQKMAQKKYSAAANAYQEALKLNASIVFLAKYMRVMHELGKLDKINQDIDRWLSMNPKKEDVIAGVYMGLGENKRAIQYYEIAIKHNPTHVVTLNNLAWLYSQQEDSRAIPMARKAYDLMPTSAEVVDTYGWILYKNQKYTDSVVFLREAYSIDPDNMEIALHLVQGLSKAVGGKLEANRLLDRLIEKKPEIVQRREVKIMRQ